MTGLAELVDFDYSVRVVLGSSHLSHMRKPVVMLELDLQYVDGTKKSKVLELSEEDLDKVLVSCASVSACLEKWS